MLTPKKQAEELIEEFKNYTHGYVGSSMLSNFEFPDELQKNAVNCSLLCVKHILRSTGADRAYSYWIEVKEELLKLKKDNE